MERGNNPASMSDHELRELADSHYREGNLSEALDAFAILARQTPNDAYAWHMQTAINGMLGRYHDAVECGKKALDLAHGPLATYKNYANALIQLSRHEDARIALHAAAGLAPSDTETRVMLGKVCQILGNLAEAEEHYLAAHRHSPDDETAALALAEIYLSTDRPMEAAAVCEKTLAHHPAQAQLQVALIECLLLTGATEKCSEIISQTRSRVENLSAYLLRIVRRMHTGGKYAQVIPAAQLLCNLFPDEYRFILIVADSQVKTGLNRDAIGTILGFQAAPPSYDGLILLATAYRNIDDMDNAMSCLQQASSVAPEKEEAVVLLSQLYQLRGEPEKALRQLETFLGTHPDAHDLLIEAGNIYYRSGDYQKAGEYFSKAVKARPDSAIAHNSLGMVYLNLKMEQQALHSFETAIRLDPALLPVQCNIGLVYRTLGEYEAALACYDKALALDPGFETAIAGKAATLDRLSRVQDAISLLETVLDRERPEVDTLLAYANVCHKAGKEPAAVELLEHALENRLITTSERMQVHFSLGKLLDRLKDYDRAFEHYELGNRLNSSSFDRDAQTRLTDATITAFSAGNLKRMKRSTNDSDALLFIVGMPRSGTTLTEQILSSHPAVYGAGELSHICNIAAEIPAAIGSTMSYPSGIDAMPQDVLDRFSFGHLQAMTQLAPDKRIITDKMPSNFMFLGLIEMLFPAARVIHCLRDPMDTCLSCYFQLFSRGQYFSYDFADLALYYRLYRKLMDHWKSTLSIPVLEVRYEELVEDTEGQSRKMLEFAGLDWDPVCADFHNSARKVLTASYDQVRKPIYNSSAGRWKNYAKHLAGLQEELAAFYPAGED